MFLILLTQYQVMAVKLGILQHEVRRPLGRGDELPLGMYFLTLSDHGREDRQSFESAVSKITTSSTIYFAWSSCMQMLKRAIYQER